MGERSTHNSPTYHTNGSGLARGMARTIKETKREETAAWDEEGIRLQEARRKGGLFDVTSEDAAYFKVWSPALERNSKGAWLQCRIPEDECSGKTDACRHSYARGTWRHERQQKAGAEENPQKHISETRRRVRLPQRSGEWAHRSKETPCKSRLPRPRSTMSGTSLPSWDSNKVKTKSEVVQQAKTAKDEARLHQFGRKMLTSTVRRMYTCVGKIVRRSAHRGLRRPRELVSLRQSRRTVQAPGSRTRSAHGCLKLFDILQHTRGEMPTGGHPEQEGKEEQDTFSNEKTVKTFWSRSGGFIYRHHELHRRKQYIADETTFTIPLKCVNVWGEREQSSTTLPNTRRTIVGMMREKVLFSEEVCTQNTHPQRAWRTIQSSHKHEHEMRACGSRAERLRCLSCSIFVRIKESVIRSAMSSPCWSLPHISLPVYHNTKHHLDSTTFSKTTLYTKNHSRKNVFQKLPGRKATQENHSRSSIMRVAETCAQTLTHVMSLTSLRPKRLR